MSAHDCPCCGDITYAGPLLCTECILAGCEQTADATGELDWWRCQREDTEPEDMAPSQAGPCEACGSGEPSVAASGAGERLCEACAIEEAAQDLDVTWDEDASQRAMGEASQRRAAFRKNTAEASQS